MIMLILFGLACLALMFLMYLWAGMSYNDGRLPMNTIIGVCLGMSAFITSLWWYAFYFAVLK